jgi:hypothetical protein
LKIKLLAPRHEPWVANWNNANPFSALVLFKKDSDKFIGHVVLEETESGLYQDKPLNLL